MTEVIRADLETPPTGAVWRGEFVSFGDRQHKLFYEIHEESELVPIIDPHTKQPMYKRGAGGVTLNRVYTQRKVTGTKEREFILINLGNGQAVKHYNFRPAAGEVEARERAARRAKFLDELFEKSEAAGGLENLIAATDDEPEFPQPKSPGRWLLSNGDTFTGKKVEAEKAEAALQAA